MADFLSTHSRTAAMLTIGLLCLPLLARAQGPDPSTDSPDQQATAADPTIPPAVAKQLAAMQKRIEQLEQELKSRTPEGPPISAKATAPLHETADQMAPTPAVLTESASQQGAPTNEKPAPFSFADFTWLTGNPRIKEVPFDTKFFTPEIRVDVNYTHSFEHPRDDTIGGSSEIFRSNEFQLTQLGVGGDFHWDNVQARLMTQFGLYSQTQPRNDPSAGRGQWNLDGAYQYLAEAYGGYHLNVMDGINIQAGIFMSYIGLYSFYNFDNWSYQPSYVSSNTPWFFNGMRVQIFPNQHLKIEPWLINGWQAYGRFNHRPGVGGQIYGDPMGGSRSSETSMCWVRTR